MPPDGAPVLIGWKERIDFPDWRLRRIRAKIDTGARTSALGVAYYDVRDGPEGRVVDVCFILDRRWPERRTTVTLPLLGTVGVKNSGGILEVRPVVETRVRIGTVEKPVRFTLTKRCEMRFAVILGRRALAGDFVVDVTRQFVLRKTRR